MNARVRRRVVVVQDDTDEKVEEKKYWRARAGETLWTLTLYFSLPLFSSFVRSSFLAFSPLSLSLLTVYGFTGYTRSQPRRRAAFPLSNSSRSRSSPTVVYASRDTGWHVLRKIYPRTEPRGELHGRSSRYDLLSLSFRPGINFHSNTASHFSSSRNLDGFSIEQGISIIEREIWIIERFFFFSFFLSSTCTRGKINFSYFQICTRIRRNGRRRMAPFCLWRALWKVCSEWKMCLHSRPRFYFPGKTPASVPYSANEKAWKLAPTFISLAYDYRFFLSLSSLVLFSVSIYPPPCLSFSYISLSLLLFLFRSQ